MRSVKTRRIYMYKWKDHKLGKYTLVSRIGSGGMASVFKAIEDETEQEVAVKVLPPMKRRIFNPDSSARPRS